MTILEVGRMLNVPIPRAIVRELGLVKRQLVVVTITAERHLIIEPLEDWTRDRRQLRRATT